MALLWLCCSAFLDGLLCLCFSIYALPNNALAFFLWNNICTGIFHLRLELCIVFHSSLTLLMLQWGWMWVREIGTHIALMFLHCLLTHQSLLFRWQFFAALSFLIHAGAWLQNARQFSWVILHASTPCKLSLENRVNG